ncbi:histidinol-phosphate transaminase [Companilactobacillus allii]|uniref:Histidinol-phosphate aminotransferase n=1 Tax=Companilactobacillus allii TaxID=1847728 RepID=A0A1P8Q316_9LACO|nr:histidinol-phosphate transaminase [Companilactobacillus allii]APX72260.1 histidinol-phosphate transaminase [Companilactobacillus allii]USQ69353.1 histidinol-phosphate transaminase [Companilactobacillus allii]
MKRIIQQLQPYIPERSIDDLKKELGLSKLVRLSANENAYGTSPDVKKAVVNWTYDQSNRYPDGDAKELRDLISKKFSLDPEQIVFGVGLDEVIVMLSRVFLSPGDEELVSAPTFSEYALHAEIEEAKVKSVPVFNSGQINFAGMLDAISERTKLIWICNPNNPTGTLETVSDIENFVEKVPNNIMVLVDEAYIDFATTPNASAMDLTKKYPNIVVMRTFSKAYGLANFRVGYAVFPKIVSVDVQKVRLPYNVNSIAQVAAVAAFKDESFVRNVVEKNALERQLWEKFFDDNKIKYYPSQANFIFFEYPDADKLADYLLHHGYLLRTGLKKNWLRLTVGMKIDNEELRNLIYDYKG